MNVAEHGSPEDSPARTRLKRDGWWCTSKTLVIRLAEEVSMGWGVGGRGGTQEEITSDWSRHASTVRTARCVPWRQGLTKENKVQLKKKESERRRKKHWLIWERLKKDPGVQREAATRRRHKFFSKMDVNWRLDVLLRGQDTNVHLSIFLNHSFNLFLSIYSPRPTQKFLSHTRMIYWWYNDLTPDFEHSDPDLK